MGSAVGDPWFYFLFLYSLTHSLTPRLLVPASVSSTADQVSSNFHLVERDIKRYITQMEEARTLSLVPDRSSFLLVKEMLERLGMWYKIWGAGVKLLDEPE